VAVGRKQKAEGRNPSFLGGAYVPTLFVGMYAPGAMGADMPKNGTSAPPVWSLFMPAVLA
jgi:hypothetical protein